METPERPATTPPAGPAAPAAPAAPPAEEVVASYELLGHRTEKQRTGLFQFGLLCLAGVAGYFYVTAEVRDPLHLYLGEAILILAVVPVLLWFRNGGSRFPVFEPVMLLCANAYAVPLLTGHNELPRYSPETITWAGFSVLAYMGAAIGAYYSVGGQPGRGRFWRESVVSHQVEKLVAYGLVFSTAYIAISSFTTWIPFEIASVLRAVFYGISILCTFITAQRWGRGELPPTEQRVFASMLVIQLFLMSTGLLLIGAVTLSGIAFLAYLSGGRRVPWVALAAFFAVFSVLHSGKSRMRDIYWEGGRPAPTLTQLPAFFTEWFEHGLERAEEADTDKRKSAGTKLLDRTSLMHMLCLVVDYTPSRQPHLDGETYGYVLPQLVPRLFWPDKPRSHIATFRLSTYYGLQDEDATQQTTIAFGMVVEAYANFGIFGTLLLGALTGALYKKLQVLSSNSPMFSLAGLAMVLLSAWSLNAELTMAAWVSSFSQALIAVLGVPLLLRMAFGM